ncbi:hypothetical protein ABTZ58_35475 [Streptomyces sp. NPDC094143]|uniref:hypothetical protein n=1 Tax=Streptomyces sp. NPDC094143 TaxID=3155310 RepID=UPI003320482D
MGPYVIAADHLDEAEEKGSAAFVTGLRTVVVMLTGEPEFEIALLCIVIAVLRAELPFRPSQPALDLLRAGLGHERLDQR